MKIGLLTTLSTNIGDDFIREGICHVLKQVSGGVPPDVLKFNKHAPASFYPSWHPIQLSRFTPKSRRVGNLISRLTSWAGLSVFDSCDAVIQCGAPVYWYGCHMAEWAEVFWGGIAKRLAPRIPFLNLAAGSCYPWERIPSRLESEQDIRYIRRIHDRCRVTAVRDELARDLLRDIGLTAELLPCSALLAAWPYRDIPSSEEFVFVNYMPGGSHYDFGQGIDHGQWEDVMRGFVARARQRYPLAFICHDQKEFDACQSLAADLPRFLPRTMDEYFGLAARGKAGVFNRMHACVGFAGLGIPSLGIGADTRMLMVKQLGLPIAYVKDATVEMMMERLESLLDQRASWREQLLASQRKTFDGYKAILGSSLFES